MRIQSVILSGGVGSRLWPLSREAYPKQFIPLLNNHSLLQETALRAAALSTQDAPVIVCNEAHRFLLGSQLQEVGLHAKKMLLEPIGRNTAPAIALAAFYLRETNPDTIMLVMPSDHAITDPLKFQEQIKQAADIANDDYLVTLGIEPNKPETGYGYIKRAEKLANGFHVERFIEKPDFLSAEKYIESGDYYWNSGIFVFKPHVYLHALKQHAVDIFNSVELAYSNKIQDLDFLRFPIEAFEQCRSESIDYAILEKEERVAVMPLSSSWTDLGSWSLLHEAAEKDTFDNAIYGDVFAVDVENSYLRSNNRMVVAVGVDNVVVIETEDAVLVANKDACQDVSKIVSRLKQDGREEHSTHKETYRPWGTYKSLTQGNRFQVKRIMVNPGEKLSLQKHFHRAEHWVVVDGTAKVTRGNEEILVTENESIYIPLGVVHRIENPGKLPLHIIEVQSGSYLGEDDIVRFEDDYGR